MLEAFGELELLEMTPGTYEGVVVSIVDNKGCMAMPNEVFTVVVYSLPTIEVELSATEVCLGESVTATVNGPVDGAYPYLVTYTIDGTPYEIEMLEAFGELELLEMTPELTKVYWLASLIITVVCPCQTKYLQLWLIPYLNLIVQFMDHSVLVMKKKCLKKREIFTLTEHKSSDGHLIWPIHSRSPTFTLIS
jgi:hypothetical protein